MTRPSLPLRALLPGTAILFALAALALLPTRAAGQGAAGAPATAVPPASIPDRCAGCHVPPDAYHYGLACHRCHSASRFVPAKVPRPAHPAPLVGRHRTAACDACHAGQRTPPDTCAGCHKSPADHLAGACSACHTPEGWVESARAAGVAGPGAPHLLTAADDCLVCHAPSGFNWPAPASHADYSLRQCRTCHTSSGKESVSIDHRGLESLFQGNHTLLGCLQCHPTGQFQGTVQACSACHQDQDRHAGQFGQDCARCHSPVGWSSVTFSHAETGFPLDGGHSGAACAGCHANSIFDGTPRECGACHAEPAYHAGVLGTGCAECHNTGGWLPASYGRLHTFPVHHKGASGCRTCHPASLGAYNCFGCHNQQELTQEHEEHGTPNWGDCMLCHPNGEEG